MSLSKGGGGGGGGRFHTGGGTFHGSWPPGSLPLARALTRPAGRPSPLPLTQAAHGARENLSYAQTKATDKLRDAGDAIKASALCCLAPP